MNRLLHFVTGCCAMLWLFGCALPHQYWETTISLQADEEINDGVLLPLDIIAVDTAATVAVLAVGPDEWFGSDLREQLAGDEIYKIAIRGGGERHVKVKIPENATRIIVYADFENANDRGGQQLVISPEKLNFSPNYTVVLKKNRMELVP